MPWTKYLDGTVERILKGGYAFWRVCEPQDELGNSTSRAVSQEEMFTVFIICPKGISDTPEFMKHLRKL